MDDRTKEGLLSMLGVGLIGYGIWSLVAGRLVVGSAAIVAAFVVWQLSYRFQS